MKEHTKLIVLKIVFNLSYNTLIVYKIKFQLGIILFL